MRIPANCQTHITPDTEHTAPADEISITKQGQVIHGPRDYLGSIGLELICAPPKANSNTNDIMTYRPPSCRNPFEVS